MRKFVWIAIFVVVALSAALVFFGIASISVVVKGGTIAISFAVIPDEVTAWLHLSDRQPRDFEQAIGSDPLALLLATYLVDQSAEQELRSTLLTLTQAARQRRDSAQLGGLETLLSTSPSATRVLDSATLERSLEILEESWTLD